MMVIANAYDCHPPTGNNNEGDYDTPSSHKSVSTMEPSVLRRLKILNMENMRQQDQLEVRLTVQLCEIIH